MKKKSEVVTKNHPDLQKTEYQDEKTEAGRYFIPLTDIIENEKALIIKMDMPGVKKEHVNVRLENNIIEIEGRINSISYEGLNPIYSEYYVGHYTRRFAVSNAIDSEKIEANLKDGVLTLELPKAEEIQPRQITIN